MSTIGSWDSLRALAILLYSSAIKDGNSTNRMQIAFGFDYTLAASHCPIVRFFIGEIKYLASSGSSSG